MRGRGKAAARAQGSLLSPNAGEGEAAIKRLSATRSTSTGALKGKKHGTLAAFQGRKETDAEGNGGVAARARPGVRPRPGEIEVPRPDAANLGAPKIGVRVAPGESARRAAQAPPQEQKQQPTPALELGPRPASPMPELPSRSVMQEPPGQNSARGASPTTAWLQSPRSPASGGAFDKQQDPSAPQSPSLRGNMSPGPRSGPQKLGLGKRSPNPANDTFSAMSTVSALSVSEDSVQAPKRIGGVKRQSTIPGQRDFNPLTGSPRSVAGEPSPLDASMQSPSTEKTWPNSPAKRYAPHRRLSQYEEELLVPKPNKDFAWAGNKGHSSKTPLNWDHGKRHNNPFGTNGKGHNHGWSEAAECLRSSRRMSDEGQMEGPISPADTRRTMFVTDAAELGEEIRQRMKAGGTDVKMAMTSPPLRDGESLKSTRVDPEGFSSFAGTISSACSGNYVRACWREGEPGAEAQTGSVDNRAQISDQMKAAVDWNISNPSADEEVMMRYCKFLYGRSMKCGRHSSEPPTSRLASPANIGQSARKEPRKEGLRTVRASWTANYHKMGEDCSGVVPGLGADLAGERELSSPSDGYLSIARKREGEYSKGPSAFTAKCDQVHNQYCRYENQNSRYEKPSRSSSVPATRRDPLLGEGCDADPTPLGRSITGDISDAPAGLSTRQLATGAAVSTCIVHVDGTVQLKPGARGRRLDHLETPVMTQVVQNTIAKDKDRMRMLREAYDRPFVDLCSAMQQIRVAQVRDARRIQQKVHCSDSKGVSASLLQSPERPRAASADRAAAIKSAMESPGIPGFRPAGMSSVRPQSPGRRFSSGGSVSSQSVEDALKWVC